MNPIEGPGARQGAGGAPAGSAVERGREAALGECPPRDDLVRWITRLLERMGGAVRIDPAGENLCRRAQPGEGEGEVAFVIESQGLPNLVHELVHALFLGRLDDDHGFDYGLIPLDLALAEHRRHLWEELACCVVSVAYACDSHTSPERALDWFVEQFEIQGVFHGLEHDLHGFRARIDGALSNPALRAELEVVLQRGYALVAEGLRAVGAPATMTEPISAPSLEQLWADYRAIWASSTESGQP